MGLFVLMWFCHKNNTIWNIYVGVGIYLNTVCCCGCIIYIPGHKKDTDSVWLTCIFAWFPHALCCCLLKLRTPPQRRRPAERQQHTWAMSLETETSASTSACCLWVWFSDILRLIHCIRFCTVIKFGNEIFLSFLSAVFWVKICKEKFCQSNFFSSV